MLQMNVYYTNPDDRKVCFAYLKDNFCSALKEMYCLNGSCPFFKTQRQYDADAEAAMMRNINKRVDISKYYK